MSIYDSSIYQFLAGTLNDVAWLYILLPCVFIGGIYLTVGSGAVQFKRFGYAMKNTGGKLFTKQEAGAGAVTPLQAVTTALAATVGTGNIVGTSQAIAMGGYGAVFWLWMAALLGMVIKYSEVVLSIRYRERDEKGDWVGGPMYYIENGMGKNWKWLAVAFSLLGALAAFGIGNMSQSNSIVGSITDAVVAVNPDFTGQNLLKWILGIGLAVLTSLVLFGGIKRIGKVTSLLVPFMSIFYIIAGLVLIIMRIGQIPAVFGQIFSGAFSFKSVGGGLFGYTIMMAMKQGFARGVFSNEAGLGSAPIAHAAAECKSPVDQGLYGIFEVFMDTLVICTLTALTIIISGVDVTFGVKPGSALITAAFTTVLGSKLAALFVAISLALFAYSTILGWSLYGSRCIQHIFGIDASKAYQAIFIVMIVVGSVSSLDFVWNIADTLNGLMAIPNFIALFALSPVVFKLTKEYFSKVDESKGSKESK